MSHGAVPSGAVPFLDSEDERQRLERKNRELKRANEILGMGSAYFV